MNRPTPVLRPGTTTDDLDDGTPVAMQFGVSSPAIQTKTVTKGNGAVGGVTENGEASKWSGENLYIFAFRQLTAATASAAATYDYTLTDVVDNTASPAVVTKKAGAHINNALAKAPSDASTGKIELNNPAASGDVDKYYYYEGNDVYQFFGYYIDDAAAAKETDGTAPQVTYSATPATGTGIISVPFVIDGSQDLMIAETNVADDIADRTDDSKTVDEKRVYSAYSARRTVVPNLNFRHVLTRFTFNVIAGTAKADELNITELSVNSLTTGSLNIVKPAVAEGATAIADITTGSVADDLVLGSAKGAMSTPATMTLDYTEAMTPVKLGESLIVYPGQATYNLTIKLSSKKVSSYPDYTAELNIANIPNKPDGQTVFTAGYSYDVTLVVYGPEEIEVIATLEEWKDGGDQYYDPDDPDVNVNPNPGTGGSDDEQETNTTLSLDKSSLEFESDNTTTSQTVTVTLPTGASDYTYSITSGNAEDWTIVKSDSDNSFTVVPAKINSSTDSAVTGTLTVTATGTSGTAETALVELIQKAATV